jgi:2-polyprenyl-3-methyl-5-hydroxy-6-metoxy-1,4-benzoquinol methylase
MQISNYYDRLDVDINQLFETKLDIDGEKYPSLLKRLFNRYSFALLIKSGLINPLVEVGFINGWFKEFKTYWSDILEGRPMYLHDFYYLLGVYRQRFQDVETPERAEKEAFLESWQKPDTMYQLFGAVRRFSRVPLHCRRFEKWINNGDTILEYGCGIAPISHSLLNVSTRRNLNITIADIRQINFHYAIHRLGKNVNHFEITPYENSIQKSKYNIIFMDTVMEHLPDPLETVNNVTNGLKQNGILVFDYILGDGDGQDTIEAVEQRGEVLQYINEHYELLSGALLENESMSKTVCRLK